MTPNKETRALARNLSTFNLWLEHLSLLTLRLLGRPLAETRL